MRFFGRVYSIESDLNDLMENGDIKRDRSEGAQGLLRIILWLSPPFVASLTTLAGKFIPRYLATRTLLDVEILQESVKGMIGIGDMTFQAAYDKTGRIINITGNTSSKRF